MNKNEPSSVMNTASPKEGKKNLVDESSFAKNYFCSLEFYYTILHLTAAQKIKDFNEFSLQGLGSAWIDNLVRVNVL